MRAAQLRVHYFSHIRDEGYGSLQSLWLRLGASITQTAFYALPSGERANDLPALEDVDLLIVMGGSMSVNDEAELPWLIQEKQWIKAFIAQNKPVLGLCLGGQLIASCQGAVVKKNRQQELGWWPIHRVVQSSSLAASAIFEFPASVTALSWHGETFELPEGAVLLAESAGCARQAYQLKHNVIGFQFHPEATPHSLALYLLDKQEVHDYHGEYVQSLQQLMNTTANKFVPANQLLERAALFVMHQSGLLPRPIKIAE